MFLHQHHNLFLVLVKGNTPDIHVASIHFHDEIPSFIKLKGFAQEEVVYVIT